MRMLFIFKAVTVNCKVSETTVDNNFAFLFLRFFYNIRLNAVLAVIKHGFRFHNLFVIIDY